MEDSDPSRLGAFVAIIDFFLPAEVLSSVLLVFTLENVLDFAFAAYIPNEFQALGWASVYFFGVIVVALLNYAAANAEEREELSEDIEDL
jgi:accessory gene regulator protein AgrB